jgi:dTDP-4-amino-4,6-dideoxygalactose transaminase
VHLQTAYADLGFGPGSFPVAENAAAHIVSLPLFPQLNDAEVAHVCAAVNECA